MERILVAVDEDSMREHVVRKADEVARALGATMTICHVMTDEAYERIKGRVSYSEAAERASSIGREAAQAAGDL